MRVKARETERELDFCSDESKPRSAELAEGCIARGREWNW